MIHALYIINKAGQLIYNTNFINKPNLSANDYLTIAGVFHGMYTISSSLSPSSKQGDGISCIECENMKLQCIQTPTGTKFFIITDSDNTNSKTVLDEIYNLYTDYVLKNPFYDIVSSQPIYKVCDKFVYKLDVYIKSLNNNVIKM